jgi:hypothetical protein
MTPHDGNWLIDFGVFGLLFGLGTQTNIGLIELLMLLVAIVGGSAAFSFWRQRKVGEIGPLCCRIG